MAHLVCRKIECGSLSVPLVRLRMNWSPSNDRGASTYISLFVIRGEDLSLPTRGLILDIDPEKEGRLEERRENADTLTRYPTYPFTFSTSIQKTRGGGRKRKIGRWRQLRSGHLPRSTVSFRCNEKIQHPNVRSVRTIIADVIIIIQCNLGNDGC